MKVSNSSGMVNQVNHKDVLDKTNISVVGSEDKLTLTTDNFDESSEVNQSNPQVDILTYKSESSDTTLDMVQYAIAGNINSPEWQKSDYISKVLSMLSWFTLALTKSQTNVLNNELEGESANNISIYDYEKNTFNVVSSSQSATVNVARDLLQSIITEKQSKPSEKWTISTNISIMLTKPK